MPGSLSLKSGCLGKEANIKGDEADDRCMGKKYQFLCGIVQRDIGLGLVKEVETQGASLLQNEKNVKLEGVEVNCCMAQLFRYPTEEPEARLKHPFPVPEF